MKHTPLTDETAAEIITLMQKQYDTKSAEICATVHMKNKKWVSETWACYRYPCGYINGEPNYEGPDDHPDHFGVVFQGWTKGPKNYIQGLHAKEVTVWLDHLLDPDGPFRLVLPHLYHTTAKEIIEDCGFVIKDASTVNGGLLWTFLQATRLMYENSQRMGRFMHGVNKGLDQPMALFCAFAIRPIEQIPGTYDYKISGLWNTGNSAHGEPLGHGAYQLAENFLAGRVVRDMPHNTGGSYRCFGDINQPPNYYSWQPKQAKSFDDWVTEFEKARTYAKAA